jgi:hypothetical protein
MNHPGPVEMLRTKSKKPFTANQMTASIINSALMNLLGSEGNLSHLRARSFAAIRDQHYNILTLDAADNVRDLEELRTILFELSKHIAIAESKVRAINIARGTRTAERSSRKRSAAK